MEEYKMLLLIMTFWSPRTGARLIGDFLEEVYPTSRKAQLAAKFLLMLGYTDEELDEVWEPWLEEQEKASATNG